MVKFKENLLEKYQKAMASANMGLWEWDLVRNKIYVDQGFKKLYGIEGEEGILTPQEWISKIHPEDFVETRNYFVQSRDNDTDIDTMFRIVSSPDQYKVIRTQAYKNRDENGNLISFVGLNWDVTPEVSLKKELKHSKSFLEKVVDAVPDPIFVKDEKHNWIFCNKEFQRFLGKSKEELIGKNDFDFFSKDIATHHWHKDDQVLNFDNFNETEEKIIAGDGSTRDILTKKSSFASETGERVLVGVIRDITEKNKMDSQFRLMVSLIDSSGDLFGFTNNTFVPVYINKTGMDVYGIQVGAKYVVDYLSVRDRKLFSDEILPRLARNESWEGEVSLINPTNGKEIPTWLNCFSVKSGQKDSDRLYAFSGSDLRRLKEIQKSLIAQSKMASLGEMAAEIAHEINNPLAIIQGKSQLLLDRIEAGLPFDVEKFKKGIEQIENNSGRIKKIINSSKAFARKSEKDPFEMVSILKIVEEAYEISRERFQKNHLSLSLCAPENVKYSDLVLARSSEIIQVLVNLLNNSFDAIKNQEEKGWVKLKLTRIKEGYQIEVIDSGDKIPPDIAEKMMDPFFTTKPTGEGTGLGLSLSRQIAESHGGHLYFDSKASNTRFVFEIKRP